MSIEKPSAPASRRLAQLIESWRDVPAFIVDRHLDVLAANSLVRRLFPGCGPGGNLLRYAYQRSLPWFSPAQLQELKGIVTAALRDSLDRTSPDEGFVSLVGDLGVEDDSFAASWADDSAVAHDGIVVLDDRTAGSIRLTWQLLEVPESNGDKVCVWGTADSDSAEALAKIASGR